MPTFCPHFAHSCCVGDTEQQREKLAGLYRKRGYTPERAAHNILRAVNSNRAVAPIAAEAHLMYVLSRAVPPLGRWAAAKLAKPRSDRSRQNLTSQR